MRGVAPGALALTLALAGCTQPKPAAEGATNGGPSASQASSTGEIVMSRGACYGTCPVYEVRLTSGGDVVFSGERNVAMSGEHTARADEGAFTSVVAYADSIGFFTMPDSMEYGTEACGMYATDMPTMRLSIRTGSRSHRVVHSMGCSAAPKSLRGLYQRIDAAAGTDRWVK